MRARRLLVVGMFLAAALAQAAWAGEPRKVTFAIRGVAQSLYLYDPPAPKPDPPAVVVLSGDGGWHGFIEGVAEYLAHQGYTTIGVDVKEYLASLSKPQALEPPQVTSDLAAVARFAMAQAGAKSVVLVGWSEGAGLAVLGSLDPSMRPDLRGVVAVGLPELNELAWRWSDSVIYLTHKVPNEPTFNSKDYVGKLAPVPLMMIQSTHDDFVPIATARDIFNRAHDPKQMVFIDARNHRFEGQREAFWQALDRALTWFESVPKPSR